MPILRRLFRIAICTLALLTSGNAWALDPTRSIAQFHHTSWTTADGMPADIWAIAQTRDGYLWLGSVNGLYRFDGVKLERVATDRLPSPSIHALVAAPSGGLWIGYERPVGVISFIKDGVVTNFPIHAPSSTGVHNITLAADGSVWASTPDTVLKFDGKRWKTIDSDWGSSLGEAGGGVWALGVGQDGTVWSKNLNGLFYLKPGDGRFVQARAYAGGPEAFTKTPDGRLWTTDTLTDHLYPLPNFNGAADAADSASTMGIAVPVALQGSILLDRNGSLWCASARGGLCRVREPKHSTARQEPSLDFFTKSEGLSSNLVHTLFEDREGNIWAGTSLGLDRFSPVNVVTETRMPIGFKDRFVQSTPRALYAYTGWSNTQTRATDGTESLYRILPYRAPEIVVKNIGRLRGMFTNDATGEMWLITPNGIQRLRENGTLERPIALPVGVQNSLVYSAAEDTRDALWISAFHAGVFRREQGRWEKVAVHSQVAATAVLIADASGGMWVRYSGGNLFRVRGDRIDDFSRKGLDIGDITLIKPDMRGLIIGGESGIAIFDGQQFHYLKASSVPPLSVVTGIARTEEGTTWVFTQAGILRIATKDFEYAVRHSDPHAFRYELIDTREGLPGAPYGAIYGNTVAVGPDGRAWFTTGNGLVWIDPNNLYHNPIPPPVVIRTLLADSKVYDFPNRLSLASGTSNMEIDYTALSLSVPERIKFRYKLDGVDDDWVDAGNRRQAFYTRLGAGQYRFHVLAANNDGVWNNTGATLAFSIPPTFLQSQLFWALCATVAALLLWVAYRIRLAQVSGRLRSQLEARLSERERIARELHDTLLQGFQGLMLRFQSVADTIPPDEPARNLIEETMTLADEVLSEGRGRVSDLRGVQTGDDLPQALRDAAKYRAFNSSADFSVVIEGTPCTLHPVVCDELIRISNEAISNAFNHARARHIEACLTYHRSYLHMTIRDDGIGIDPKVIEIGGRHGHFGLAGMRERAERIRAHFAVSSRVRSGTEIEITVPASVAYAKRSARRWHSWRFAFTGK